MIYYILIATILFLGYFYKNGKEWYRFSIILLWFFTAFRHTDLGGTDALFYKKFFERVPDIFHIYGFESDYGWGYIFLNSIVKTFSSNYLIYQIVYTSFAILLLNLIIKKMKIRENEQCLFLFIYFCYRYIYSSFVVLRQNIANLIIWLLILEIYNYTENRRKQFFIFGCGIVTSILFHSTSIFNIIVVFIYCFIKGIKPKVRMVGAVTASLIIFLLSKPFTYELLKIVIKFSGDRYSGYIDRIFKSDINFVNFAIRLMIVIAFGYLYYYINYEKKDEIFNAAIVAMLLGSIRTSLATRYYEYFAIGMYGTLTVLTRVFNDRNKYIYLGFIYIFMLIIMIRFLIIQDGGAFLNYRLAFFE